MSEKDIMNEFVQHINNRILALNKESEIIKKQMDSLNARLNLVRSGNDAAIIQTQLINYNKKLIRLTGNLQEVKMFKSKYDKIEKELLKDENINN